MTGTDKFSTMVRLFKSISAMPRDQQLILLKQMLGDDVSRHLFKRIIEMTQEQQIILLEHLERQPRPEIPVHTISLEENGPSMRENPRKPCLIDASYRLQDSNYHGYILDISIGGVFIETDQQAAAGTEMLMKFSLPNQEQPFRFSGRIAWNEPKGLGVKFEKISASQMKALKSFIDQND